MKSELEIFPRALVTAARTFAKRPETVGRIMVALVTDGAVTGKTLTEVERYIIDACREEIADRAARREREAERKRRSRAISGAEHNTKGGK